MIEKNGESTLEGTQDTGTSLVSSSIKNFIFILSTEFSATL